MQERESCVLLTGLSGFCHRVGALEDPRRAVTSIWRQVLLSGALYLMKPTHRCWAQEVSQHRQRANIAVTTGDHKF